MTRCATVLACAALVLVAATANAVRSGDEQFEGDTPGYFVVPADLAISIVNPVNLEVVKNITTFSGAPLLGPDGKTPRKWSDAIYAEDPANDRYYIFINEVDVYTDTDGSTYSHVTVVDTVQQEIVARVRAGPALVHGYSVFEQNEYWAHSDAEGQFYVISLDEAGALASEPVKAGPYPAFFDKPGHGKLLVDDRIYPNAYATNVNQQYVFEIDLRTRELSNSYSFASQLNSSCPGTHSIGFSKRNLHLYIECTGDGGVLEWDTVTKKVVKQWNETFGAVYSTHDADSQYVLVSDAVNNRAVIFQPEVTGEASTIKYTVPVEGNPGHPIFYPKNAAENETEFSEYLVFFPLTRNTNKANIAAVEALGSRAPGDVTSPGYAEEPFDCKYAPATALDSAGSSAADSGLQLATGSGATPQCGSCAPQNPATDFQPNLSGFRYFDVQQVIAAGPGNASATTAKLIPAGAVLPAAAEVVPKLLNKAGLHARIMVSSGMGNDTNECAYAGEDSREGHRGGRYVAVYAAVPAPALYVVDAKAAGGPKLLGTAPVGTNPARTTWAPIRTYSGERTPDDTIVGGGVAPVSGGPAPAIEVQSSGVAAGPDAESPAPAPAPGVGCRSFGAATGITAAASAAAAMALLL